MREKVRDMEARGEAAQAHTHKHKEARVLCLLCVLCVPGP